MGKDFNDLGQEGAGWAGQQAVHPCPDFRTLVSRDKIKSISISAPFWPVCETGLFGFIG